MCFESIIYSNNFHIKLLSVSDFEVLVLDTHVVRCVRTTNFSSSSPLPAAIILPPPRVLCGLGVSNPRVPQPPASVSRECGAKSNISAPPFASRVCAPTCPDQRRGRRRGFAALPRPASGLSVSNSFPNQKFSIKNQTFTRKRVPQPRDPPHYST
jgi:hypothetical protein